MSLLKLLMDGRVADFNAKRGQRTALDMFAADLSGLTLDGVDFSSANLEKSDLTEASLIKATLAKTNLCGADLTDVKLDGCIAVKARFRDACMSGVSAIDAEFGGADLTEAELTDFTGTRSRFAHAKLKGITAPQAKLQHCDFTEARLVDANLAGADLSTSRFSQADLSKADLTGANLIGADLSEARLSGAKLCKANLTGARLVGADLSGADLTDAILTGADLTRADLFQVIGHTPAPAPATPARPTSAFHPKNIHVDQASFAVVTPDADPTRTEIIAIWEEAGEETSEDENESLIGVSFQNGTPSFFEVPVPGDAILAREVLPGTNEAFLPVLLDSPGGVLLNVFSIQNGTLTNLCSTRLGYVPVVKPMFLPDKDGFFIYGIGRQGAISVHRCSPREPEILKERLRAPSNTYRGFCGRNDPILLGKGGTITTIGTDGIGRLITAPASFPGRLSGSALGESNRIGLLWTSKEERGFRFQVVGGPPDSPRAEPMRGEPKTEISTLETVSFKGRFLVCWAREAEGGTPAGCWFSPDGNPIGKPFTLVGMRLDVTEIRVIWHPERLFIALTTFQEGLVVVELSGENLETPKILGKLGP